MSTSNQEPDVYLPWAAVRPLIGNLGRATVWRAQRRGDFPAPVRVSPGRVAWSRAAILAWQVARSQLEIG